MDRSTEPIEVDIRPWRDVPVHELLPMRPWWDEQALQERGRAIEQRGDGWVVAIVDGEAVAWIVLRWHGRPKRPESPVIEDLFVMQPWRSRGIGSALIRFAEAEARDRGHRELGISVNPTLNERARALYERMGYEHDGGAPYLDGVYDGDEDWVIDLAKRL